MRLIIATRNRHKVHEIQSILGPAHPCLPVSEFPGAPEIIEDAPTFVENAAKKARELARWLRSHPESSRWLPEDGPVAVLADDSGLEVDALHGAPGVHSARFAALDHPGMTGNSPDADNNAKLLRLLKAVSDGRRTARFRCALALLPLAPGAGEPLLFQGTCEGRINRAATGVGGFGYDPLFVPDGYTQSFGELGDEVKNRLSHRSRALVGLKAWLAGGC